MAARSSHFNEKSHCNRTQTVQASLKRSLRDEIHFHAIIRTRRQKLIRYECRGRMNDCTLGMVVSHEIAQA